MADESEVKIDLSELTDEQNMLLTQLSYESDVLAQNYDGMALTKILERVDDEDTKIKLQQLIAAGLGSLKIKAVGNDSTTGFGAIAFTDDYDNTGISYRGTDGISWESLNDWGDNIVAMVSGTSPQSLQAEMFFDENRDSSGNNYLYGHSKGGELSESVYVNNYQDIEGVHLLNPQPINPYALTPDQLAAMQSDKVDIVIIEGDYVWFLGSLASYGNIRIAEGNGSNAHFFAAIADMFDENGNITEGSQPWWEYAAYFGISNISSGLQMAGGKIGQVYNCVVRAVDFVKNDLIPAAKEFVSWVVDGVKELGQKAKEFAIELKNYLDSVVEKAIDWVANKINSKLYPGSNKSYSTDKLNVSVTVLRQVVANLESAQRKIYNLDWKLDSLRSKLYAWEVCDQAKVAAMDYTMTGSNIVQNLAEHSIGKGYDWELSNCIAYLNTVITKLEQNEDDLVAKAGTL